MGPGVATPLLRVFFFVVFFFAKAWASGKCLKKITPAQRKYIYDRVNDICYPPSSMQSVIEISLIFHQMKVHAQNKANLSFSHIEYVK